MVISRNPVPKHIFPIRLPKKKGPVTENPLVVREIDSAKSGAGHGTKFKPHFQFASHTIRHPIPFHSIPSQPRHMIHVPSPIFLHPHTTYGILEEYSIAENLQLIDMVPIGGTSQSSIGDRRRPSIPHPPFAFDQFPSPTPE